MLSMSMGLFLTAMTPPQQSAESALQFIKDVSSTGATGMGTDVLNRDGVPYRQEDQPVAYVDTGACMTSFVAYGRRGAMVRRTIDWSSISEVESFTNSSIVFVNGRVVTGDGSVKKYAQFRYESPTLAARVAAAMSYLKDACDKTRKYGF